MQDSADSGIVCIVDDDEAVLQSTAMLLEAAGFHVDAFESAEAFLSAYSPVRNACLLLDSAASRHDWCRNLHGSEGQS